MNTQDWYERAIVHVEQTGNHVQRILLTCNLQTWHVWERPNEGAWPDAEDWDEETQKILSELAEMWPARPHQVVLVAENKGGTTISQCPLQVIGRNKSAGASGADQGVSKTVAETVDMLQRAWEKTLTVQNAQLELQSKQLEKWGQQVLGLMEYVRHNEEYRATEAQRRLEEKQEKEPDPLRDQLAEQIPVLVEIAQHWVGTRIEKEINRATNGASSTLGKAATAAAQAVVENTLKGN